ncbi:MAG: transglutaminase-like domain-containing protein [Planctomycetes bacterium]|nr:transglutaminase-like domain-containing protein [Planctomycetota bacterium]
MSGRQRIIRDTADSIVRRAQATIYLLALAWFVLLSAGCAENAARAEAPTEVWDVFYIGEAKVGHARSQSQKVEEEGRKLERVDNTTQLTLDRLGQSVTIEMQVTNFEAPNGDLLRFDSNVKLANMPMTAKGYVADGKLNVEGRVQGQAVKTIVDCPAGTGGIDAVERSLSSKPLKPGEKRQLKMFLPMFNVVADVILTAGDFEDTGLLEGKNARLLKIDNEAVVPGQGPIRSTAWTDQQGTLLKSVERGGMGVTTYRTSRENALREGSGAKADLINLSIVKIMPAPRDPHRAKKIVYRVKLADGNPAKVFPSSPSQIVKSLGPEEAEITAVAIRPESELAGAKPSPPTDGDRKPNVLIQSDDAKVVELAGQVVPKETDPWKVAVALERHVRDSMKTADFSQALASAAEVARNRRGDCTEYAVLLAALARARGIAARVVVGLVYAPSLGGFGFHMWDEVWIKDRWIALDATRAQGGIGGGHLKLSDANLADGSPTSFLPVYQVMGKLKVNVISEEP